MPVNVNLAAAKRFVALPTNDRVVIEKPGAKSNGRAQAVAVPA